MATKSGKVVNLALVGCGGMAGAHLSGYEELWRRGEKRFRITATVDEVEERAQAFAKRIGQNMGWEVATYKSIDQLLNHQQGLDGADIFNVYTAASGPSRNLFVDGGLPAGKKKSTDKLNVFYTPPRPSIIHSAATQDPDAGLVDLDYGGIGHARFLVQYDGIEQVVIARV